MLQPVVTWCGGDGRQQRVLLTEMGEKNSKQGVRRSRRGTTRENLLQGVAGPAWPGGPVYQSLQLPGMEQIRGRSQRSRYEGCVSLPFILHMTMSGEHVHPKVPKRVVFHWKLLLSIR